MTDRGLYARWLFQQIVALGWRPLHAHYEQEHVSQERIAGHRPGRSALFQSQANGGKERVVAFPRRARSRLDCTLFALREFGHEEPWFIVTDLEPDQSEGLWYAMRAWIEHGFKLLKSQGWQWQKSRMTDPDRASRLWLVLAVATRYVLAVGGEADASDTDDERRLCHPSRLEPLTPPSKSLADRVEQNDMSPAAYVRRERRESEHRGPKNACDERFPSRNGSIDGRSDCRTRVAEAPSVKPNRGWRYERITASPLINPRPPFQKTPPCEGGRGGIPA